MPTISTSTTITLPAGQKLVISGAGATATATVNPGSLAQIYDVGSSQDILGPFDRATPVRVEIRSGSVTYNTVSEGAVGVIDNSASLTKPDGSPASGGGAVDAMSGLLISNVSGQDFAQLPVGPSPERAIQVSSFVPRNGIRSALEGLSGSPNEIGTVSDLGGIALFTGTPGGAKFIYPDNAGRTMLYETDATVFNSVIVDVPNDVSLLVVRNTGPAAPSFDGLTFRFANSPRDVRKPLRVIKDAGFAWGANDNGLSLDGAATDATGFGVLDFLYDGTTFQVVSAVSVAADGSTSVGKGVVANGTRTTLIGSGARAFADNEIAFSTPVFSGSVLNQRGTSVCQLAGLTSSATTSCVLTDSGTASDPGLPIDMAYLNGLVAYRIEVLGKRNSSTDFCRFVRDAVVQIDSSGALTLVTPSTQNNPADIFVGSITGNTITLEVDDVNKTLKITVTGSTTPQAMRWYARVEAMKMGNS